MRPDFSAFTARFRMLTDGLPLKEIADALGVTESQISAYRSGRQRPRPQRMPRLAERYGGTVEEWLALAGYEQPAVTLFEIKPVVEPGFRPHEYFADLVSFLGELYGDDLTVRPADFPAPGEMREQIRARLLGMGQRAQAMRDRRRGKGCPGQRRTIRRDTTQQAA